MEKIEETNKQTKPLQIKEASGFGGRSFYIFPAENLTPEQIERINEAIREMAESAHLTTYFHAPSQGGGVDPQKPRWEIISQVSDQEAGDFLEQINNNL